MSNNKLHTFIVWADTEQRFTGYRQGPPGSGELIREYREETVYRVCNYANNASPEAQAQAQAYISANMSDRPSAIVKVASWEDRHNLTV